MGVRRSVCTDEARSGRQATQVPADVLRDEPLGVDGYNLLITIESALSGGVILIGRDGCCRDLASIHGTYRRVCETGPALEMILNVIDGIGPAGVDWYLDRPVSNSGRLKTFIAELIEARKAVGRPIAELNIQLVDNPDQVLGDYDGIVATSDSVVLDRCRRWMNLAAEIIDERIPGAFKIDLRGDRL